MKNPIRVLGREITQKISFECEKSQGIIILTAIFNLLRKLGGINLKKNIGKVDQIIRIILGLILVSFFFLLDGGLRYIGIIGLVLILTSFMKFCPLYTLFGINTNKANN